MWIYDETKGWFHSPSTLAETGIGPDRYPVRINALGLRGPEILLARAGIPGAYWCSAILTSSASV